MLSKRPTTKEIKNISVSLLRPDLPYLGIITLLYLHPVSVLFSSPYHLATSNLSRTPVLTDTSAQWSGTWEPSVFLPLLVTISRGETNRHRCSDCEHLLIFPGG